MADKKLITDRYLRVLPPAPPGQRVEILDARLPGFGIRISDAKDITRRGQSREDHVHFVRTVCLSCPVAPAK